MTENREVANITDVITILVSFSIKNANFFFITMSITNTKVFFIAMSMTMTDVFVIRRTITMTYVFVVTTRSGRLPYTGYKGQPGSKIGGAGHSKQAIN